MLSPLAALAVVVLAAMTVVVSGVMRHEVSEQEHALLQTDAYQLATSERVAVNSLSNLLTGIANVEAATANSPTMWALQTTPLAAASPSMSMAIVHTVNGAPVVALAAGTLFSAGEALPPPLASAVATAGAGPSLTELLTVGNGKFIGLVTTSLLAPKGTALIQVTRDVTSKAGTVSVPGYADLYLAVYASKKIEPAQFVAGSLGSKPIPGPTASAIMTVGTGQYLLVASARHPLVSLGTRAAPWIVLAVGLLVALLVAMTVEVINRRRRYAEARVDEATARLTATQHDLVKSERLAAMGEMTLVMGHEIRNPLSAITNAHWLVDRAVDRGDAASAKRQIELAQRETARATAVAEDLLAYARERPAVPEPVDLGHLVDDVLESLPAPPNVSVERDLPPLTIEVDERQMHQILINVMSNAYQAMPEGGTVHIEAGKTEDLVVISIDDDGEGFDDVALQRAFEPFFTTKVTGTGLGLAIVKRLIDAHAGAVSVENRPEGGARVQLRIPATVSGAGARRRGSQTGARSGAAR